MADKDEGAKAARKFRVIARTRAAANIPEGEFITINYQNEFTKCRMEYWTQYENFGFEATVPAYLMCAVEGEAKDIREALAIYGNTLRDLPDYFAVVANAAFGSLEVEIAYEATEAAPERDFFQQLLPAYPLQGVPSRILPKPECLAFLNAIAQKSADDRSRLKRTVAQYAAALERWTMGDQLAALSHLFMGVEALAPAARRFHLEVTGKTRDQLAAEWGYDARLGCDVCGRGMTRDAYLNSRSRLHLIFENDSVVYETARRVSDDLEHGLKNFGEMHDGAEKCAKQTANYLRRAIFRVAGLPKDVSDRLLSAPFDEPRGQAKVAKYLWGTLKGDVSNLNVDGAPIPRFTWKSTLKRVSKSADGKYQFSPEDQITAHLPQGVQCTVRRQEVWDAGKVSANAQSGGKDFVNS